MMMLGRAGVVFDSPQISLNALKIALRFGVVRRNAVNVRDKQGVRVMVTK